jgi:UDP-glucuronate 4-epimerase
MNQNVDGRSFTIYQKLGIHMKILVTGGAGFIGFHLISKLLHLNHEIHCLDNLDQYYDPKIKHNRIKILSKKKNLNFINMIYSRVATLRNLYTQKIIITYFILLHVQD